MYVDPTGHSFFNSFFGGFEDLIQSVMADISKGIDKFLYEDLGLPSNFYINAGVRGECSWGSTGGSSSGGGDTSGNPGIIPGSRLDLPWRIPEPPMLPWDNIDNISENGLGFIRESEGFIGTIYRDAGGRATIGYGHLLTTNEAERFSNGITREQGGELLRQDVGIAVGAINRLVNVRLNQNQFDALSSFVFNVGTGNFSRSTLLRELNRGNYDAVPAQLLRWVNVNGVQNRGLRMRRMREINLFRQRDYNF